MNRLLDRPMAKDKKRAADEQAEDSPYTTIQVTKHTAQMVRMLATMRRIRGTHTVVTRLLDPILEAELKLEMSRRLQEPGA